MRGSADARARASTYLRPSMDASEVGSPHAFQRTSRQRAMLHAPNPLVRAILRSPVHRLLSGKVLLLRYTGRRSGTDYTIPVQYVGDGQALRVTVGWPERKLWWRNLRPTATPVTLTVRGKELRAIATVEERDSGVAVILTPSDAPHNAAPRPPA